MGASGRSQVALRSQQLFSAESEHPAETNAKQEMIFRNSGSTCDSDQLSVFSLLNSRNSHTFANFQSRITVSREIFKTSAVSSTLSPPKKRSSTTWLFLESTEASWCSASSSATISSSCCGDTIRASSSVTC